MPLSTEHKQKTRQRIVECARELFNRRGFEEVSIDEIMQHAGLTRGGFYNHFKAKEDLYAEAISTFLHIDPAEHWKGIQFDPTARGEAFARQVIEAYLSTVHLEAIENQCPMIALPSDTARAGPRVRQAYRCLVENMVGMLEHGLDTGTDSSSRQRSLAITALCVGGMVLARTVDNPAFADEVRLAARNLALELIGSTSD